MTKFIIRRGINFPIHRCFEQCDKFSRCPSIINRVFVLTCVYQQIMSFLEYLSRCDVCVFYCQAGVLWTAKVGNAFCAHKHYYKPNVQNKNANG